MKKMKPVLAGEWKLIGTNPDLGGLGTPKQQCVDHHVFRAEDGQWHLWGCIRGTRFGRLLYHWKSERLYEENWEQTGECFFPLARAGESIDAPWHEHWIQSPFFVKADGQYYMFYGGHATGYDMNYRPIAFEDLSGGKCDSACQICLMTSPDGIVWTRHEDEKGFSRLFTGPGETRDPCLIKVGNLWHMYYAGNHSEEGQLIAATYLRTSEDLLHWSNYKVVAYDPRFTTIRWCFECPHVVEREGYYYLFITKDYASKETLVYRSCDPTDFGIGAEAAEDHFVCKIAVGAPEIIIDANRDEYITSNHDLAGGTRLCPLKWEEE